MTFTLHPQLAADTIPVGDFPVARLLMINDAAYPWFILVPRRDGIKDAFELSERDHLAVTRESRALCAALMKVFNGEKMNVAALGNMVPQLHIHHVVRFKTDPAWPGPIWGVQDLTPYGPDEANARSKHVREALKNHGLRPLSGS